MKLSVLLNSSRADDTLTAVKTLLNQVGPDNQLEVVVRFNNAEVEAAALKYMPKDDRVVVNGVPTGDKCWIIGDAGLSLPPFWDNDLNITKNFVDLPKNAPEMIENGENKQVSPEITPKMAEIGEIAQEVPTNGDITTPLSQPVNTGTPPTVSPEVDSATEDWQFTNIVDIDATTRIAILKKV